MNQEDISDYMHRMHFKFGFLCHYSYLFVSIYVMQVNIWYFLAQLWNIVFMFYNIQRMYLESQYIF